MRLNDLDLGEVFGLDIVLRPDEVPFSFEMVPGCEVILERGVCENEVLLRFGEKVWSVQAASPQQHHELLGILQDYLGRLSWITDCALRNQQKRRLGIQVHAFISFMQWADLQIGVDERLVGEIRSRHLSSSAGISDACLWLTEQILMPSPELNGASRIVVLGADKNKPFAIRGRSIVVDVQKHNDKLMAMAVRPARSGKQRRETILVEGHIAFRDASTVALLSTEVRTQIEDEANRSQAYLNLWHEYNELERQNSKRKAQQFGYVAYRQRPTPLPNGNWRFVVETTPNLAAQKAMLRRGRDICLESAEQVPPEILGISRAVDDEKHQDHTSHQIGPSHFRGKLAGWSEGALEIEPNSTDESDLRPPPEGFLYVSLHGDVSRLNRRDEAQVLISSRLEPMHLKLSAILLGISLPVPRRAVHDPLSKETRRLFKGPPTARQEEALRIALNTPDIALIQGPPGTGKTQVIAALSTRLTEITKDRMGVSGAFLISSFQHEAVQNAVSKISVLGLPAVKVGEKGGRHAQNGAGQETRQWRKAKIEEIEATLHETPSMPRAESEIRAWSIRYSLAPVPSSGAALLLEDVLDVVGESLQSSLRDEVANEIIRLQRFNCNSFDISDDNRQSAMMAVRGIRTDLTTFEDDGPRNAMKALIRLRPFQILTSDEESILENASQSDSEKFKRFPDLARCKSDLLAKLCPKVVPYSIPAPDPGVESVLHKVLDHLHELRAGSPDNAETVVASYLADLRADPDAVGNMLRQYTAVLAATCQQSNSRRMLDLKNRSARPLAKAESQTSAFIHATRFNSVVIDEAARANPLDLLIPMSLAQERIVLVGDHRQLPHILEPEIERQLEKSIPDLDREALDKSLFERLFILLKERERKDGIRRTITLDTQYRMHRELGDFISRNFYEVHGESAISAGWDDIEFEHHLPGYEKKVCAWIDVPHDAGPERDGQSKSRPVEADRVAQELKRLMNSDSALTFGVITFYEAQRRELEKGFMAHGLGEEVHGGDFRLHSAYEGRLECGTVDSFQGKEFDVVLLSMTRSNTITGDDERALRGRFGHLMVENRLCVAMSRQKRLLIVVGDASMLRGPAASSRIRGLVQFYQLCGGEHGIRI